MKNLRLTPDFFRLHAMPKAGGYFAALFLGLGSGMGFTKSEINHICDLYSS
ncbi:MAG: hypothetical protein P8H91_05420 [Flavobacteriaceae bacterium]|jgi:hypothetical protein|nr:hypothetical protein [Flavobacteriaceae bacterium]MDG2290399.1 hypothetical protein [Flavobacteriaceae bacterium]